MKRERHGQTKTRFYQIWQGIKRRCNDSSRDNYSFYGGRGITCRWDKFSQFKKEMFDEYNQHIKKFGESNTFIERINPDGDYCLNNCSWSNRSEQARNRRSNVWITHEGKTLCLQDWAKKTGIHRLTIKKRLDQGWSIASALTVDPKTYHNRV